MVDKSWDGVYQEMGEFQRDVLAVVRRAAEDFRAQGVISVLDAGCGTGRHTYYLAQNGFTVTGIDLSEEAIRIAKEKSPVGSTHNPQFLCGDISRLHEVADAAFDACICIWTTGHGSASDLERLVKELMRIVRPGGIIYCDAVSTEDDLCGQGTALEHNTFIGGVPGEESIPHHYSTKDEMERLLAGAAHITVEPIVYTHSDWGDMQIKAWLAVVQR